MASKYIICLTELLISEMLIKNINIRDLAGSPCRALCQDLGATSRRPEQPKAPGRKEGPRSVILPVQTHGLMARMCMFGVKSLRNKCLTVTF